MSDNNFYLTTPIYYVNARPHIGHAYTTIVADVLARRHRLLGEDTFFLTGTDEHGQKIERSAAAAGIPPQQFADQVSKSFEDLWHRMGITNNDYIRTTSDKHKRGVQHLFSELYKNGFIYLASYTGSYCVSDEAFVDAPVGTPCPDCGRLLEEVTEENFFFKLSAFQLPLLDLIESDTIAITPDSRKNEVLSFLRGSVSEAREAAVIQSEAHGENNAVIQSEAHSENNAVILSEGRSPKSKDPDAAIPATTATPFPTTNLGAPYNPGALKDLSISRSSFTWGIPVPEPAASAAAQKHVIYVWLDALANYMTALGYGSDDETLFKKFWPADLHLVGKEIIRFHCIYWPAFLLALNPKLQHQSDEKPPTLSLEEHKAWAKDWLPKAITAHGWLLFDDSKMSKSKGNIVRTETILDAFGTLCPPPALKGTSFSPSGISSGLQPAESGSNEEGASAPGTALKGTGFSPSGISSGLQPTESGSNEEGALAPGTALKGTGFSPSGTSSGLQPTESGSNEEGALAPGTALKGTSFSPSGTSSGLQPTESGSNEEGALAPGTASKGTSFSPSVTTPTQDAALAAEGISAPTQHDRDLFASDVLRYFLLREIPFGQDGSFSFDALITRYNADLANGYGNLVSRTLTLVQKGLGSEFRESYDGGFAHGTVGLGEDQLISKPFEWTLGVWGSPWTNERWETSPTLEEAVATHFESMRFGQATEALWQAIRFVDNFLSTSAPWKLIGSTENGAFEALDKLLYTAAESIRIITALLYPILPYATSRVWSQLGLGSIEQAAADGKLNNLQWGGLKPGTKLGPLGPIFPRADKGLAQIMTDMENPTTHTSENPRRLVENHISTNLSTDPAAPPRATPLSEHDPLPVGGSTAHTAGPNHEPSQASTVPSAPFNTVASQTPITAGPADASPQIAIDDFAKVELRVAQILVAERIPKADKLLRLEVDLGPHGKRQILSGIAEWYAPEDLIGRRIVVITNLAPRKMRGLESHGMLLAASDGDGGKPVLATFGEDIALGSRLK